MVPASRYGGSAGAFKREPGPARKRPDEISFLDGPVAPELLDRAADRAASLGVGADEVLLADGAVTDDDFYGTLAGRLGAAYVDEPPPFAVGADWRAALHTGVVRLRDGRWLMAPRGRATTALLLRISPEIALRLVITTPARMERALIAAFAPEVADHASEALARERPDLSAKSGASAVQRWAALAVAMTLPAEFVLDYKAWTLALFLLALVLCAAVLVRIVAALMALAPEPEPPVPRDADLPRYSVLVALYRETEIVPRLVAAMRALDYPAAKLEVIFIVEADDADTRDALCAQDLPPQFRVVVAPNGAPRTKPRALNVGLLVARGELVVVYDAEDRPDPGQLKASAARFRRAPPDLALLQAVLRIENRRDSWLTRLFAIDYAAHFEVLLPGMGRLGLPLPLGGTSNHFRTDILRRAGGWDAWNVTEDADLGLRLGRLGGRAETLNSVTWEEAPPGLRDWFPQRRRWLKGWMQTLVTHTRDPLRLVRDLGAARALHALALLVSNTFGPAVGLWFTLYALHEILRGDFVSSRPVAWGAVASLWASLAVLGVASIALPTAIAVVRGRLWDCALWLLIRPLHWLCVSAAAFRALHELWVRPFHWAKTRHGIARAAPQSALVIDVASMPKSSSSAS